MPYATDAAAFLFLSLLLVVASCWRVPRQASGWEAVVLGCCVLLGAFGSLFALQGLVLKSLWLSPPLLVIAAAWAWPAASWRGRNALLVQRGKALSVAIRNLRGWEWLPAFYIAAVVFMTFLLCLVPPSGGDYDALVYHLAAPQQYLRAGRVVQLSYDHHTYFPFTIEMLFLAGLSLRGPVLAKLFHWLMLPLCCAALVAMGQRHLSRKAGLAAAAMFASLPLIQSEASLAYVDLGFAAFVLAAFLCFANWLSTRDDWWLLPCAVFCGFCMGTKYLGVLTFGWLLLWLLLQSQRLLPSRTGRAFATSPLLTTEGLGGGSSDGIRKATEHDLRDLPPAAPKAPVQVPSCTQEGVGGGSFEPGHRQPWLKALNFAVISILIGGGWYIRNWCWTGNPVYPFAYGVFGGRGWTSSMATAYTADQMHFGFGRGPLDLLLLPWRLAMSPLNFGAPWWPVINEWLVSRSHSMLFETGGNMLSAIIGPPLLAFGLPAAVMPQKPPLVRFLLWTFAAFFVFWAATGQYMRYLVPPFALLCLPCGWALCRSLERGAVLRWTVAISCGMWLIFAPLLTLYNARSAIPVVLGSEPPREYLSRTFPGYLAMDWASTNTPVDARFAVYGEPRCYGLDRDYFWADQPHNTLIDYSTVRSGADLVARLRGLHATHLLWNTVPGKNGGVFGPPPELQQAINDGSVQLLFEARGYRVYKIVG